MFSSGKTFELGFFTPDGSFNKRRYLGVWYYQSNPKVVVWVANRDKPLLESNGCLVVTGINAALLDTEGENYWSTHYRGRNARELLDDGGCKNKSVPDCGTLMLNDNGNLVFSNRDGYSWQSFNNPTDTFLPGMDFRLFIQNQSLLTSWKSPYDPAAGNFTMQLQQNSQGQQTQLSPTIFSNGDSVYWKNIDTDPIPPALSALLLGNTSGFENINTSRLVMNFNGQLQYWEKKTETVWHLVWSEPKDQCSIFNACGGFSSCNSDNGWSCKCLPGYNRSVADQWNPGDFSGGCSPKFGTCSSEEPEKIPWLRLPMMKVELEQQNHKGTPPQDCEAKCRVDCDCVAYSCGCNNCSETCASPDAGCWTFQELTTLQEEYPGPRGYPIFIRTMSSDIALTSRDCEPCGTNIIPYPLSTGADCGDPSYFNFHCNTSTGQLGFSASNGTFKVTATNLKTKSFTIQIRPAKNCDRTKTYIESLILSPKSMPFKVINCSLVNKSFAEVPQSFVEVEMAWDPPQEPACSMLSNCSDWANTTCKATRGGRPRCICKSKFKWDGQNLKCVREKFHLKVALTCISGALAVVLLCAIYSIHRVRKRMQAERQGPVEFQGDDTRAIDVPSFDWESILAATNNFADENRLGTGGFGAVYKGKLPDGKIIAVKRLSSVSEQGITEFMTEVVLIAKLQHRNLVRLLGYCVKADERILVYEYMANGSLDSCLFDQARSLFMDWEKRFDIIFGIARGLLYLHQDSRLRIIHRDLKPSNILLDEEMNPKISDFGIARIVEGKETEGSTKRVVGTYGYMSPEYAYEGLFSVKSDVFSFGIVVLETISGRRNSKLFQLEHSLSLQGYAWKLWNEDRGLELMDQALNESCNQSEVLKCIHIGLLCVQEDPSDRPTMSSVVWMLGTENASLPKPKQPAFISKKEPSHETASSSSLIDSSLNEVITISAEGR